MTLFWISWRGGQECGQAVTQSSEEADTQFMTHLMSAIEKSGCSVGLESTHSGDRRGPKGRSEEPQQE